MKILKRVILLLVVVIAVAIIYVAFQPSDYNVSRSHVIKAPISMVYNTVNDLQSWERWGPWHDEDTTIVVSYGDKTVGVRGTSSWTSLDGPGNMVIDKSEQNKLINVKLQFADYEPSDLQWTFEETPEGTKVSWFMKEENAPFVFKIFAALSGGWDGMFGPMQEQGLQNLDTIIMSDLKLSNSFRFDDVKEVQLEGNYFIGFYHKVSTEASLEDMSKVFMESMPKAGMFADKHKLKSEDYTPSAVYTKWDEEKKEAEMYIGLMLKKAMKPGEGMVGLAMPKGKGVMVRKYGNYGTGDKQAHQKLNDFMALNSLNPTGLVWEMFTNDPIDVQPQDIQTDIYYAVE